MKTSKIAAAALALIIPSTICLSGCSMGFFSFFNYTYENGDKYTAGDREIEDKITTLNIDYVSGDVKLTGTDTDTVSVKETSNKTLTEEQKVHTWVDGNTLYVRYCASTKKISFDKIEKSLEINIPGEQDLDDLTVHISSGNLGCNGVTTDNLNVKSSSGGVGFSGSASDIVIKASSGNIYLDQDGDSNSMDINSSSGSISINQKGLIDSIKLHASSGNVNSVLDKASKLDISVSSGDITIEADEITELKSRSSSGCNEFKLGREPQTSDIHSSSGNVKIYLPDDSNITVRPHISSGEFNYEIPFAKNGKNYVNGNGTSDMKIEVSSGNVDIFKA